MILFQVCVDACPSTYWVYLTLSAKVLAGTAATSDYDNLICKSGIDSTEAQTQVSASVSILLVRL